MKTSRLFAICVLALAFVLPGRVFAAGSSAKEELTALAAKVQAKIARGDNTEAAYAGEIAEFDALLAKHKAEKTDEVAQILVMKALLYIQVFKNAGQGVVLLEQLTTDFAGTSVAAKAATVIDAVKKQRDAEAVQASLVVGKKFPDFAEADLNGRPLSVAALKGKVVLIDFWATWCGPCVAELPNVVKAYQKHHAKGFEIVGVSLDKEGDRQKLIAFTKSHDMPWAQIYDGKYWDSKLAGQYGIRSIPATFLLDAEGNIAATDLRGEELDKEIARLLAKR